MKIATGFTLFQVVYAVEAMLHMECEILLLKLAIELLLDTYLE